MLVLIDAGVLKSRNAIGSKTTSAVLLFSALTHDFAKPSTTALRDRNGRLRWTA